MRRVTEQWEDLRDQLTAEESTHAELEKERDALRKAIEEKDNQIQVRSRFRVLDFYRSVLKVAKGFGSGLEISGTGSGRRSTRTISEFGWV